MEGRLKVEFFDSHAHYDDEKFNEDREEIIEKIYNADITKFISAGYSLESSKKGIELVEKYDYIYTTSGISPNDVKESIEETQKDIDELKKYSDGVQINLNQYEGLEMMYHNGKFITAYFPSERKAQFMRPNGVENITLENTYGIDESAGDILLKYMVHLKTQQAYARNEGDQTTANQIQKWFDRFDSALQILLDEESIHIEYDYKNQWNNEKN